MPGSLTPDCIAELLKPFLGNYLLSSHHVQSLELYLDLLLKWNSKMNLTAVRDAEEIVQRHFGESLFAAKRLFPSDSNATVIDIGSGAGFPGLPIKLWVPSLQMTLVEANQRKATFLREVVRALKFESVSIRTERAESISDQFDLATMRAVESFDHILSTANSLVKPQGRIAMLIGEAQVRTARSILPKVAWNPEVWIPNSTNRVLLVGQK